MHREGYRDVTTKTCNRKDGVKDSDNPNHDDLSDYTIGRKKCSIPTGVSHDAGVVRYPAPTTASPSPSEPTVSGSMHVSSGIFISAQIVILIA
jgi:hypothetical protein